MKSFFEVSGKVLAVFSFINLVYAILLSFEVPIPNGGVDVAVCVAAVAAYCSMLCGMMSCK